MQVAIDARALKPFTRALTCISKYGDEMIIHAAPDRLVLSALNLAKTAYCSFTYKRSCFQRYSASRSTQESTAGPSRTNAQGEAGQSAKWMLQTKALLSVLKHRNTDKTADKCELIIVDGVQTPEAEIRTDEDSFETRLIVRLHCKHGIIKTHRLLLNTPMPMSDDAPLIPSSQDESRILVQAHAVREIIEHVPGGKGARSDPELVWSFGEDEVRVSSMEKGINSKSKSQLATELTLGADEFDYYNVPAAPLTLGFFLREFNATITLADAFNIPIDFRFTTSTQPICINAEADGCNMLFIIATNPARAEDADQQKARSKKGQSNGRTDGSHRSASGVPVARKRALGEDATGKVPSRMRSEQNGKPSQQWHTTSAAQGALNGGVNFKNDANTDSYDLYDTGPNQSQPLFLASQLSVADVDAIRESGLGIENMDAEEFAALLDGEGDEVGVARPAQTSLSAGGTNRRSESARDELEYDELDEDVEMGPTQLEAGTASSSEKAFRPLFED